MAKKRGRPKRITAKQKSARRKNIKIAQKSRSRAGTGRTGMGAKVKKWLNDELLRSKGSSLSDFTKKDRKKLYKTYGMMGRKGGSRSIRGAVDKWSGF